MADDQKARGPVLFLNAIERRYRQGEIALEILRGAELGCWLGQSIALIAPSGAGKSTFLHIAGLLEHPDSGEVFIDGRRDLDPVRCRTHPHPAHGDRLRLSGASSAAGILRGRECDAAADDARAVDARKRASAPTELLSYLGLKARLEASAVGIVRRRAAARRDRARGRQCAAHPSRRRADRQSRSAHRRPRVQHAHRTGAGLRPCRHHRHPQHGSRRAAWTAA